MVWNTNMAAVSSFLNTNIWAPWRHVKTLCRRKEQKWTRQSRKALRNMIPMISNVFWNVKQFRSFQWGHNTLCSKTMLSPKRNSRQLLWKLWRKTRPLWYLWKGPQFLPHPHESKYFRNNIVFTRILVHGALSHSGERFKKDGHSVADSLVLCQTEGRFV